MTNLIMGLICLALGSLGIVAWWDELGSVLRGVIPVVCILLGLAAIGAGMKSKRTSKFQGKEADIESPQGGAPIGEQRKAG